MQRTIAFSTSQSDFDTGKMDSKIDEEYFRFYADYKLHAEMLRDSARVHAYKSAIERASLNGKVVLDVGCGTGILAAFCAKSGTVKTAVNCSRLPHRLGGIIRLKGKTQHCFSSFFGSSWFMQP
jgi:2-polyprenyl-3-methyl-5-hydroxy-6-metoxy-1,4-benzoquinol methylase